jgi:sodium/pantothenate symporter
VSTITQALILAWASYTSFTLYSGSRGVVITDTMMFVLFSLVSFLAMFSIFETHGGWLAAFDGLMHLESKPNLMAWYGMSGPGQKWETPARFPDLVSDYQRGMELRNGGQPMAIQSLPDG